MGNKFIARLTLSIFGGAYSFDSWLGWINLKLNDLLKDKPSNLAGTGIYDSWITKFMTLTAWAPLPLDTLEGILLEKLHSAISVHTQQSGVKLWWKTHKLIYFTESFCLSITRPSQCLMSVNFYKLYIFYKNRTHVLF